MAKVTDEEIWKAHPEYPIDVSTHGQVRSQRTGKLYKLFRVGRAGGKRPYKMTDYMMSAVGISRPNGKGGYRTYVHTLVLETFVGPRPEGYEADHEDFNPKNNRLSNLAWIPKEENQRRKASRNFQLTR